MNVTAVCVRCAVFSLFLLQQLYPGEKCYFAVLNEVHLAWEGVVKASLPPAEEGIKILLLHCLFLPQMFSETHFSYCLAVI